MLNTSSLKFIANVVTVFSLFSFSTCFAQQSGAFISVAISPDGRVLPGPDPNNPGQLFQLVNSPEIQRVLGIEAELAEELNKLAAEMTKETRSLALRYRKGEITIDERIKSLELQFQKMQDSIEEALTPAQNKRLVQIVYRLEIERMGLSDSLTEGRLSEIIGLHENQKSNVRRQVSKLTAEADSKVAEVKAELERKTLETLTPEQRSRFAEAVGGYIDVTEPSQHQRAYVRAKMRNEK